MPAAKRRGNRRSSLHRKRVPRVKRHMPGFVSRTTASGLKGRDGEFHGSRLFCLEFVTHDDLHRHELNARHDVRYPGANKMENVPMTLHKRHHASQGLTSYSHSYKNEYQSHTFMYTLIMHARSGDLYFSRSPFV